MGDATDSGGAVPTVQLAKIERILSFSLFVSSSDSRLIRSSEFWFWQIFYVGFAGRVIWVTRLLIAMTMSPRSCPID